MQGTIAITDYDWYELLRNQQGLEETNFWKPSATRAFHADAFSPFIFKLRAPHNAICGFGFFARYSRLLVWLAWECFGIGNGCESLAEMRERIGRIRDRTGYKGAAAAEIGCVLIVQPVFFPPEFWVRPPENWPVRTQADKKYDLTVGEGARVWEDCLRVAADLMPAETLPPQLQIAESPGRRYGMPTFIVPRLGQGTFRVTVTEAYGRGCAVTDEHSLPALEAAHIKSYVTRGPHDVRNGVLLRADLHRLFDQGYITLTSDLHMEVSRRLREDFANGRSYYPFHGKPIRCPTGIAEYPSNEYIRWHNENIYLG